MKQHRRAAQRTAKRLYLTGLVGLMLSALNPSAAMEAVSKRPAERLRQADSLSLYYAEELYHDPSLADSLAGLQDDLKTAFAKPARLDSLETAWKTAMSILERLPDGTAGLAETAGYLARQVAKVRPEQTWPARLRVWRLLYEKGVWRLGTYRNALQAAGNGARAAGRGQQDAGNGARAAGRGQQDAGNGTRAAAWLALAETYRFPHPDSAHFYATQALAWIEAETAGATTAGAASAGTADSATAARARLLISSLEAPFFSVSGLHAYTPGRPMLWSVCAKNVRRLPYRIFRVPAEDRLNFLSGMMPLDRYAADKQPVREGVWLLERFPQDCREHRAELSLPPLPAGTYLLAADNKVFLPFQVSGLAFIDLGTTGFTVGRASGAPVAGVTLDIFTAQYDYVSHLNRYERLGGTRRSQADGAVSWEDLQGEETAGGEATGHGRQADTGAEAEARRERLRLNRFFLLRQGEDSLIRTFVRPPFSVWNRADAQPDDLDTLAGVHFFLDLPVYKAGDSVRFKGVLWARRAGKGAPFTLAGRRLILSLGAPDPLGRRGRSRQAEDETPYLYIETDSLGGFTGGFRLPDAATAGLWQLRARLNDPARPTEREKPAGAIYIAEHYPFHFRVEAYRPPQFEIQLENRDSAVWGRIMALDGQALTHGNVRIDIRLADGNFWRPRPAGAAGDAKTWQASLTTDADGCFRLPIHLFTHLEATRPDDADALQESRAWGGYDLTCTVTDLNGEIQTASLWLPLQSQPWRAELLVPENRLADKADKTATDRAAAQTADTFKLLVRNALNEIRTAHCQLTIYRLNDTLPDRAFDRRFPEPDRYLIPLETFLRDFPDEPYFTSETRQAAAKRQTVFTHDGRDTAFTACLPDGHYAYRVRITHPYVAGRTDSCEGVFTLGRQPLVPAVYADFENDSLRLRRVVPETIPWADDTAYAATHLYYSIENRNGRTKQGCLPLNAADTAAGFDLPALGFTPHDDLNLLLAYVCGGRLFQQSLYRPGLSAESPLTLTIDRLSDSARTKTADTLTLQVSRDGQSLPGRPLTLALYDDALHAFAPENWFSGRPPRIVPPATPTPFDCHFYGYDPLWFTQDAAYTSPDAYRFDLDRRSQDRGGRKTMALGMRMAKSADANETALTAATGAAPYAETGAETAAETEPGLSGNLPRPRDEQPASVYFFPTLYSDADGRLQLPFRLPAAPGRYRWVVAAYDRDLQAAYATQTTRGFQDYRLSWQPPRFIYAGDSLRLSAKATRLDAVKPQTGRIVWEIAGQRYESTLAWTAGESEKRLTAPVVFSPRDSGTLAVKLYLTVEPDGTNATNANSAAANSQGDALQTQIPVLPDRLSLREHIPFYIRPGQQITMTLPKTLCDALRQSPTVDTVFFWPTSQSQRIELLCNELTLDSADHAYNALWHYLKARLLHGDKSRQTANTYQRLCRFLTPDGGFCWLKGQPTDPVLSLAIAEALAANAADDHDVRYLLQHDLLPYLYAVPSETEATDGKTAATDSLPSANRLRLLYAASLVYGTATEHYLPDARHDLDAFAAHADRYPISEGVHGLYALHLHGDTALFAQTWQHYRRAAFLSEETGLSWRRNDMGRSQGERLKTASLVYRMARSRHDYPTAAAVSRWIGQQNRTTDLLSPAAAVRPMDVLTLAYNERLFPLPALPLQTPATWKLQGRKLTIDWRTADDAQGQAAPHSPQPQAIATPAGQGIPDSAIHLFGTYGALTFGYTQKLSAVAASPASDLRAELLVPAGLKQGDTPLLQLRIESKRPASYVRVRFGRPGGSEYGTTRAGFVYKNGLAFYEDIQTSGTDLLIPFLPAGRYLLSYPLNAQTTGRFALPPATIETLLEAADSFSAHSRAAVIRIQAE